MDHCRQSNVSAFRMLSRLDITFLPRTKCLLISWLKSPSAVILDPKKIRSVSFHCFSICLPWIDGTRLQQYVNHELPDVQAGLRKGRGTRDQIDNIHWIIEKTREFQTNIYFCFIDYAKAFDCVDHNKLWKILQEMGIPDHLTCLLRNLYAG